MFVLAWHYVPSLHRAITPATSPAAEYVAPGLTRVDHFGLKPD